jgi:hypothetical protein
MGKGPQPPPAVAAAVCAGRVYDDAFRVVGRRASLAEGWASLGREKGIEVIGEYSENKSVWMELTGGARGLFTLGSGLRMRPRFP